MAIQSLTDLKALINSTIQDNTTNDISGSDVQTALINAIDTLDSLEGFINVHKANGQTTITAYGSKALARAAVPDDCKKEGVVIAYKISTGWLIEQNLDATAGTWGDDASWQTIGPVSVSQNTNSMNVAESVIVGNIQYNIQDMRLNPISENLLLYAIEMNFAINVDNDKWYVNAGYDCKIIKVYPNEIVDIQSQADKIARFSVLKSIGIPTSGETPDYATGYSGVIQMTPNSSRRVKIPSDGQFLYVAKTMLGNNYYPSTIKDSNSSLEDKIATIPDLRDFILGKSFNKGFIYKGYINHYSDNNWFVDNPDYGFVIYPVYPGEVIKITAQETKFARYALLADFKEYYGGLHPDLCANTEFQYQIAANTSEVVTMPSDAKYILVYDTLVNASYYPSDIVLLNGNMAGKLSNFVTDTQSWLIEKTASCINLYKGIGSNKYIKYPIQYFKSAYTEGAYPSYYDCWDMDRVKLCHYENGAMVEDFALFREGLAECAISVPRGDGQTGNVFVGGGNNGHGFENINQDEVYGRECRILLNKQKIAEDSIIPLQEVVSFSILQRTLVCQAYTNSNPFARFIREWKVENGNLTGSVSVTFLREIHIANMYIGMMCVFRHKDGDTAKPYITNKCITSDNPFFVYDLSNSPAYLPISAYRTKVTEYGQLGLGFAETIEDDNKLSSGGMFISDNGSDYNKIYFSVGSDFTTTINQNLYATFKWEIE